MLRGARAQRRRLGPAGARQPLHGNPPLRPWDPGPRNHVRDQRRRRGSDRRAQSRPSWAPALGRAGKSVSLHVGPSHHAREGGAGKPERGSVRSWGRKNCWSTSKQSFTFYAGTEELDCAVLLAAHTGFCAGDDPLLRSTVDTIRSELTADGPLLFRYTSTRGKEGAFLA